MTENKISRRDAMKLLGAAVGAAALSTLPSKWNTPELAAGVLPAHARQSGACAPPLTRTQGGFLLMALGNGVYFPFNEGPITASELDSCPISLFTIAWTGAAVVGTSVWFALATDIANTASTLEITPATPNPYALYAPAIWSSNRPYNGFVVLKGVDANNWVSGAISVTLSF